MLWQPTVIVNQTPAYTLIVVNFVSPQANTRHVVGDMISYIFTLSNSLENFPN